VDIGHRLRELREQKSLSQGDIEHLTGLLRCYISRVENGHTVSALETLEKITRALEMPLYQLFYEGEDPPALEWDTRQVQEDWASRGKGQRTLREFRQALAGMSEAERRLVIEVAVLMVRINRNKNGAND
jgi:transcriptional regulator with XRE-family HTH domain